MSGGTEDRVDGRSVDFTLRDARQDDMEWVVPSARDFYAEECGWHEASAQFRAELLPTTLKRNIPAREQAWIAEVKDARAGCAFLTRESNQNARLELLVAPCSRGLGIGTGLLNECVRFARAAGYRKLRVWTIEILFPARHMLTAAGFRIVHKEERLEPGQRYGDETWELDL